MAVGGSARKGSGKRQRWGGKMGVRVKVAGKWTVRTRSSTHGGHSQAAAGWECGAPPGQTKIMPGRYKRTAPTKRHHRKGHYGSVTAP